MSYLMFPPDTVTAKVYADSDTIPSSVLRTKKVIAMTGSGKTLTLPTPGRAYLGVSTNIVNTSSGLLTLSCTGGILGGNTCVVEAYSGVIVECIRYSTTYKWLVTGQASALTGLSETIADTVGAMVSSNTETGIAVAYQDADNTLDFTITYGTDANTACQGNDSRLSDARTPTAHAASHASGQSDAIATILTTAEHTALASSANWGDIAPTVTWDTAPASVTMVARSRRIGNAVEFYIDLSGADGDDRTITSITMPVAALDQNAEIPCSSSQYVADNPTPYTNPYAYVDAETDLGYIKFKAAVACVNGKAWRITISGRYEVASA